MRMHSVQTYDAAGDHQQLAERNRLVLDHIGLVKGLALRMARRVPAQVEVSELISVGMVGLIDAAGRYRASLGVPFDAFARRRVQGAMLDWLRNLDWAPRSVRKLRRDVDSTITRLRHELHREPSEGEIAGALGVSEPAYDQMLDQIRAAEVALIRPLEVNAGDSSVLDVAIDPGEGPHLRLERTEMREHLAQAIAELPERERQILSLYYQEELTLAEIGAVIGVGESRVSQLRTQAIARIRTRLRETLRLAEMQ
jgi:RNA polymerase sigma factor for flagellar operon FliA